MATATLKTHLTEAEVDKIIASTSYIRDRLIITLLYRLGCRVSELVNIKVNDIDFQGRLVLILHLKRTIKRGCSSCGIKVGRKHSFCPGCGTKLNNQFSEDTVKQRLIPFDNKSAELIREYLGKRRTKNERLIPLTRQAVFYIIRNAAQRAGLGGKILLNPDTGRRKSISPHRFRDALALRWLETRGDIEGQKALQEHLGHQSFNTTARYLKLSPGHIRNIYDEVFG